MHQALKRGSNGQLLSSHNGAITGAVIGAGSNSLQGVPVPGKGVINFHLQAADGTLATSNATGLHKDASQESLSAVTPNLMRNKFISKAPPAGVV